MSAPLILVVDDDAWILRMVTMVLEKKGYRIVTASDGSEAEATAIEHHPDLIVTDVMMPHADGWALVKRLRSRPEFAFTPVIFLTALGSDEDRIRGFRLGADDYIPKPFRFEELDLRVAKALKSRDETRDKTAASLGQKAPAMQGNLEQLGLPSVLTVLELERKSGTLRVTGNDTSVVLTMKNGRILSARTEGQDEPKNQQAVFEALGWTEGLFEFDAGPVDAPDEIDAPTTSLLMEGARLIDESNRFG